MKNKIIWNEKPIKKPKKFRILAIDGGGAKGYFTAYALYKLKEDFNINILDGVDLVVGTSTGSIIAASLLFGVSTKEIFHDYEDDTTGMFIRKKIRSQLVSPLFSKFESDPLKKSFEIIFGNTTLADLYKQTKKSFIFTATNFNEAQPIFFGSPNLKLNERYSASYKIVNVLLASTAAPLYFEPFIEKFTNDWLLDGGLWANNPSLVGIMFAINSFKQSLDNIEIISFGQTFLEGIDFKPNSKLLSLQSIKNYNISHLYTATLVSQMNFINHFASSIIGKSYYRYEPDENVWGSNVSQINESFKKSAINYYNKNKESLVHFIKEGINLKK